MPGEAAARARFRREPPPFRRVTVLGTERLTPRLVRVTLTGPELRGLVVSEPAASVRLLLSSPGEHELVVPTWNGNEFLLPDARRPVIRTFTPFRFDADAPALDLEIVVHGRGAASDWAAGAEVGADAAISGTGRGYTVDPTARGFLLAGDETAIPAISQLLEAIPLRTPVHALVELAEPSARVALPDHPLATAEWLDRPSGALPGDALVDGVRHVDLPPGTKVWAAGEAAAVQRIRRHLFDERGVARSSATVRGYWKRGSSGDTEDAA